MKSAGFMQISTTVKMTLLGCSTSAERRENLLPASQKAACVNPMKLSKTKCKTLHLVRTSTKSGWEENGLRGALRFRVGVGG